MLVGFLVNYLFANPRSEVFYFLQQYWPGLAMGVIALVGITIWSKWDWDRNEEETRRKSFLDNFKLLKPIEDVSPEDLGFQKLEPGARASEHNGRPFYAGCYLPRQAVSYEGIARQEPRPSYTEEGLAQALTHRTNLLLVGPPLDGKSHTLYQTIKLMTGYQVIVPIKTGLYLLRRPCPC